MSLLIRFFLMDDGVRIRKDVERLSKPKAILWTHKNWVRAGRWMSDLRSVLV